MRRKSHGLFSILLLLVLLLVLLLLFHHNACKLSERAAQRGVSVGSADVRHGIPHRRLRPLFARQRVKLGRVLEAALHAGGRGQQSRPRDPTHGADGLTC